MANAKRTRRRAARRHPLRWRAEALSAHTLVGSLRALPEARALAVGASFGRGLARFDSHYRRLAQANLALVFPNQSADERNALLADNFAELGRTGAEWARMPSLSADEVNARVEIRGIEHLRGALESGRGAIVVTAHFGYWEMLPRAIAQRLPDLEVTAVERVQPNSHLAGLVAQRRQLGGVSMLPQKVLAIRRALGRNAAVGLLADHYLSQRRGGLLVPFLGRPAWSNPGPAALALQARCPVVLASIRRVDGVFHRLELAPLEAPKMADRSEAVTELTARINAAIGVLVRDDPRQWLWPTHRFRNSPDVSSVEYPSRRQQRGR